VPATATRAQLLAQSPTAREPPAASPGMPTLPESSLPAEYLLAPAPRQARDDTQAGSVQCNRARWLATTDAQSGGSARVLPGQSPSLTVTDLPAPSGLPVDAADEW
jgi:hypothetical protein